MMNQIESLSQTGTGRQIDKSAKGHETAQYFVLKMVKRCQFD